ncbi:tetratricopeptide repeat protein [Pelosinus sp. UFO1]|uniref:tetratricopeptide repeat protein n=1 Tax=Pelosinus sp. UFO1 TaxID=484770 RepID=UPI0004D1D0C2|nr:tetratricopeptide repeat protein [Pelosinus sp. UFO1]AIF54127.1 Tetratricopeptide TPR_1 repeat-containing protein [Pelosinus sp. UFO1]
MKKRLIIIVVYLISLSSLPFFHSTGYAQEAEQVEAITKQIEARPNSAILYFLRGFQYAEAKQYHLAVNDYSKAIELQPQGSLFYICRAYSYSELKKYDMAMTDCNRAIDLDPKNAEYYSERGYTEWKIGNFSRSIDDFTKAIELNPAAHFYDGRGNAYGCMGKYNEAIRDFEKAVQLNPKEGMAYFNLAQAYDQLGDKERALSNYQQASEIGVPNLSEAGQVKLEARLNGDWSNFKEWI